MKGIIAILLLAGAAFGVRQYAFPAVTNINKFRAQLAEMEDIERRAVEAEEERDKAIDRLRSIGESNIAQLDLLLPERPQSEELYVFFDVIAKQAGMKLDSIKTADAVARASNSSQSVPGKKSLSFDLSVSGTYSSLRTFLDTLERNTRLSDVRSLDITTNAKKEFTLKVQGNVYYAN